jgi:hypothetical protein
LLNTYVIRKESIKDFFSSIINILFLTLRLFTT